MYPAVIECLTTFNIIQPVPGMVSQALAETMSCNCIPLLLQMHILDERIFMSGTYN